MKRWALVTGASSGIGRQFCEVLAQKGWNLVLVARRESLLKSAQEELQKKYSIDVAFITADVSKEEDRQRILNAMTTYQISFLVNNAGIFARAPFAEQDMLTLQSMMDINILGLTHLTHGAVLYFKNKKEDCYILNVGSLNSFIPIGESSVYSGTKAYVKSFTMAIAEELKGTNIHLTCVCPGGTESEMLNFSGLEVTAKGQNFVMSAEAVARSGIEATLNKKSLFVPGSHNKLLTIINRLMPEKLMINISSNVLRSSMQKKKST